MPASDITSIGLDQMIIRTSQNILAVRAAAASADICTGLAIGRRSIGKTSVIARRCLLDSSIALTCLDISILTTRQGPDFRALFTCTVITSIGTGFGLNPFFPILTRLHIPLVIARNVASHTVITTSSGTSSFTIICGHDPLIIAAARLNAISFAAHHSGIRAVTLAEPNSAVIRITTKGTIRLLPGKIRLTRSQRSVVLAFRITNIPAIRLAALPLTVTSQFT